VDPNNDTRRTARSFVPGLLISGAAVVVLVLVADPARAVEALVTARPVELAAAVVVFVVALGARAAASRELVDARTGLGGAFAALNIGYLFNNVLPLRLGEAARVVVLGRRSRLGVMGGAAAVAGERLLDLVMAATVLVTGLALVGVDTGWTPAAIAAPVSLIGVATLVVIARRRHALAAFLEPRLARWPRLAGLAPRIAGALDGLARPRRLASAVLWLGLSWLLGIVNFWLVLRAFIPDAPLAWAVFGIGVMAFGIALPSSPGAIGVYEAAWVGALALCGADPARALAFAVASHALSFVIVCGFGLVALIREVPAGDGLVDRARMLLAGRTGPSGEEAAP
jgi:uncharacterized membrane protein YbhN (UPF0104 family)